ncbi:MAG: metFprotein [Rhodospirillaceae bacterium]|jgi:methylenetetrahydrofolate reductase (NADPH)|nr:metFprotein [Rhodospirillaceae bacterium]MBT6136606.1 metFprotein [Rhodospirillaceae bacterium]
MDANQIMRAMRGFSIEATPASATKIENFTSHLAPGTTVNVTFLADSDPADTIALCTRLRREGLEPVPHVAARGFRDEAALDRYLGALTDQAGVREVLVIAGGLSRPVGAYDNSMQVLASGLLQRHGITRVGIAGHPEGSPDIPGPALAQAIEFKNDWARETGIETYIETQFCFDPDAVLAWERTIRAAGNRLPIHIGVPGPASLKTLLKFAQMSGVGPSMRVLTRNTRNLAKLLSVQAPDRLIAGLARGIEEDPNCLIQVMHFYPFGGLAKTAGWANAVSAGRIVPKRDNGFDLVGEGADSRVSMAAS